jgi:hypothetical protein
VEEPGNEGRGEPDDPRDHNQEVGHERSGARIILGHSLSEEKRQQREPGENCAIERNRGIVPEKKQEAAHRAEGSSREFHERDQTKQQGNRPGEWTLGEMPREPIEVPATVDHLVDAGLEKKDREEKERVEKAERIRQRYVNR